MRARSAPQKSSLTIRDIARLAGVSAATVSRVVNRDARVSTAKRGAVMAVIEQVHYQPSVVAQWLARGTSQAFGVVTEDLASDFYGQALKGIEAGLRNSGYHPIFASGAEPAEAARRGSGSWPASCPSSTSDRGSRVSKNAARWPTTSTEPTRPPAT